MEITKPITNGGTPFRVIFKNTYRTILFSHTPRFARIVTGIFKFIGIYNVQECKILGDPIQKKGNWIYNVKLIREYKYFFWCKYKTINYENL